MAAGEGSLFKRIRGLSMLLCRWILPVFSFRGGVLKRGVVMRRGTLAPKQVEKSIHQLICKRAVALHKEKW